MDWSHVPKPSVNYHQARSDMEPTRKKKTRSSKEHVEKGSRDRHIDNRIHMEADWNKAQIRRIWKTEVNGLWPSRDDGQNGCDVSCL